MGFCHGAGLLVHPPSPSLRRAGPRPCHRKDRLRSDPPSWLRRLASVLRVASRFQSSEQAAADRWLLISVNWCSSVVVPNWSLRRPGFLPAFPTQATRQGRLVHPQPASATTTEGRPAVRWFLIRVNGCPSVVVPSAETAAEGIDFAELRRNFSRSRHAPAPPAHCPNTRVAGVNTGRRDRRGR